jgi:hypothetical protein
MIAFFAKRVHYRRMRPGMILVLFSVAPLHAGVVYDFVTTIETSRGSTRQSGQIAAQRDSYRADLGDRVLISHDRDQNAMVVDLAKCTWTWRSRAGPLRSSALFHLPTDKGDTVIGEPAIEHRTEGVEPFAGFIATKHVILIEYRVVGVLAEAVVRGTVTARATIWSTESLPPLPMHRELRTGHAAIDEALASISAAVRGMIVRHELEVTRTFEGGATQVERTITSVKNVRIADLPDSLFALPPDAVFTRR